MDIVAPTSVYLYYDRNDILIYVGITSRGIKRNFEHNTTKDWWPFVARQEVEHFDTRQEAAAREKSLISAHCPPFNIQHNPAHAQIRTAYLLFAAAQSQPAKWREAARAMQMRLDLDVHEFGDYAHIVLRTRVDDASVVAVLEPAKYPPTSRPRVLGYKKVRGVTAVEKRGPLALIHLSATRSHPLLDAFANVQYGPKQQTLVIRNVHIRLDHSDTSLCNKTCPTWQRGRGVA